MRKTASVQALSSPAIQHAQYAAVSRATVYALRRRRRCWAGHRVRQRWKKKKKAVHVRGALAMWRK
eukprot:6079900-Pyramimonas_sp.AAC.1